MKTKNKRKIKRLIVIIICMYLLANILKIDLFFDNVTKTICTRYQNIEVITILTSYIIEVITIALIIKALINQVKNLIKGA